jgi:UDP-glucose 4-epimerase
MTETWLVTGGAGYIGSHVVRAMLAAGQEVVVLDDLSTGLAVRVDGPLVVGDCGDRALVRTTLAENRISGVVHLAAGKAVEESVRDPLGYYRRNLFTMVELLDAMADAGVDRFVYSSSAAVYGETTAAAVGEDDPTVPVNPYGETKLAGEWLIRGQARAVGLRYAALRYFNVAGTAAPELADATTTNLVPLVLDAIEQGVAPRIFGDDYPTPDGTCVRDYIHVADLAQAHVDVIAPLDDDSGDRGGGAAAVYNVGCGVGYSVREVISVAAEVTGRDVSPETAGRRAGDPARVVADNARITTQTSWRPRHDLRDMVASAWDARQNPTLG